MLATLGAALLLFYLPGAVLFRLPIGARDRRAALDAGERGYWHLVLSVAWSISLTLALAALDRYRFSTLLAINGGLVLVALLAWRGRLRYGAAAAPLGWTIALPIALLALGLWRFFPVSEYVIGGKDPGVYINEGIQIAQRGSLVIRDATVASVPPFARDLFFPRHYEDEYYSNAFMGFFIQDPAAGRIVGQFPHGFPASVALGYGLHGLTGARQAVAWWGLLGLLGVYFLGARLFGRGPAFAASALLALHVVQVWFSRYPNSDIVMQALGFAALLALARAGEGQAGWFGGLAGWLLGLGVFNRVDGLLVIAACGGAVALQWAVRGGRLPWTFLVTLTAGGGVALIYMTGLMQAHFWRAAVFLENLPPLAIGGGLAAGAAGLVALAALRRRHGARLEALVPGTIAGVLIGLALYAFFLREPGGKLTDYDAYALRNFVTIYLGVPMFLLTLAGLAVDARREFWRHPAFVIAFAGFAIFLLYKIKIVPEHFWLSRRFLAMILPGALLIGCAAAFPARTGPAWRRSAQGVAGIVLLSLSAITYLRAAGPVLPHVEYRGIIPYVEALAARFTPDDLVILESRDVGSDIHVLGPPLAYIYDRQVLALASAAPDRLQFREFVADALGRYRRVLFVGTGGTTLLSRQLSATPLASDRVQIEEFEVTTDRLPAAVRRKEFDYGVYALSLGASAAGPFRLDLGERDDLHVVRFHAKEQSEGRSIRWTQDASEVAITGLTGEERAIVLVLSDGGRPATAVPARVDVFLGGRSLGTIDVAPGFREYTLAIPPDTLAAAAVSDEPLALRLVSTVWSPRALLGVNDSRDLGVMVDTLEVR